MYFDLTDDQKAIREAIVGLLGDHLPDDRLLPRFDAGELDRPLWHKLNELGIGATLVAPRHEGLDLGLLTLAVIAEALGHAGAAVPTIGNALAAWLIAGAGSDDQRARWLPGIVSGATVAAFALAEPAGWQPADWQLAGPVLNGRKHFVEWGGDADLLIVGTAGGNLVLVEAAASGVERTAIEAVDRNRPLAEITFADVAADPLAADMAVAECLRDAMLVLFAADACGAGERALAMAVDYAKVRSQFGQLIGSFQGLRHQLADMAAEMTPCRPLTWYAAHAWDAIPERRGYAAAMAKAHVTDIALKTARRAVEAHGGIGYTWEYPLHIFLKRAMFDQQAMGSPTRHRARAADAAGW